MKEFFYHELTHASLIVCEEGYHLNGNLCVPDNPPPPLDPPPVSPDAAIPAGNIYVHDTNLNSDVPVRQARVVARRWFKTDRTYTDNAGHFVFSKRFKHKVRINVKFKNDYASVRGMRGIRLWQMLFPVKKTLGIYSSDKSTVLYVAKLTKTSVNLLGNIIDVTSSNKSTRYWAAATTLNTVQEYRDYATAESIGLPPTGIRLLLSNYGKGSGFTPMYGKRGAADVATESVEFFLNPLVSALSGVVNIFKDQVDIGGSYNFRGPHDVSGYDYLSSDAMKELFYHELTHAAHYQALGNGWYTTFVANEAIEIINNLSSGYAPYGNGVNGYSPQIALGEGWAYHIGHYFTDKKYGITHSDNLYDEGQAVSYNNGYPTSDLSSHLNLLENFNPAITSDPFHWIPTGLFYDMIDNRNDKNAIPRFLNIDDQVSGYTNSQLFNAFSTNVYSVSAYKTHLLELNGNNQSLQVTSLFSQYGY